MKVKFIWKAFINKIGKRNFILFIIIMFCTFCCFGILIKEKGVGTVILLTLETILVDYLKEFYNVLKKANDEYQITIKK